MEFVACPGLQLFAGRQLACGGCAIDVYQLHSTIPPIIYAVANMHPGGGIGSLWSDRRHANLMPYLVRQS